MNKKKVIFFLLAAAALYYSFINKTKKRRGSLEIPPINTFTTYIMSAGSVIYDDQKKSNVLHVFRGGEKVFLIEDKGEMKYINYTRSDQKVITGYIKKIDIRK